MTLTCHSFRCDSLPDGRVQLTLESPTPTDTDINPTSTKVLYVKDVAKLLRCDPKTIHRMSRRRQNPLPLKRGCGRPFILERDLACFTSRRYLPPV